MQNFQDVFEKSKRPFISEFSIWMTVPLTIKTYKFDSSFFFPHYFALFEEIETNLDVSNFNLGDGVSIGY